MVDVLPGFSVCQIQAAEKYLTVEKNKHVFNLVQKPVWTSIHIQIYGGSLFYY